jgi:hypothetical protein
MSSESDKVREFPLFGPPRHGLGRDAEDPGDLPRREVVVVAVRGGVLNRRQNWPRLESVNCR